MRYMEFLSTLRRNKVSIFSLRDIENIIDTVSSYIVAALREQEEKHEECKRLLEQVKDGNFIALEPYTVLVEVVAAIKRRTGSAPLGERVKKDLQDIDTIKFLDLDFIRADDAANIAKDKCPWRN